MSEIPPGRAPRPSIDFGSTTRDDAGQPCCAGCSPDVLVDDARPDPDVTVGGDGKRYVSIKGRDVPQSLEVFINPSTGGICTYNGYVEKVDIQASVGACKNEGISDCVPSAPCSFLLTIKIKIIQSASTVGTNGSNLLVPTIGYVGTLVASPAGPVLTKSPIIYGNMGNGRFLFDADGRPQGYSWDSFIQVPFSIECGEQFELDSFATMLSVPGSQAVSEILYLSKIIRMICTGCYSTSSEV